MAANKQTNEENYLHMPKDTKGRLLSHEFDMKGHPKVVQRIRGQKT
jgi:hypothetical protein